MPMAEETSTGFSTLFVSVVGAVVGLAALVKSMATDGHKTAQATNENLFALVNTLQGTVNTLVQQQATTQAAQLEQENKIGSLTAKVENLQRDNEQLHRRVTAAEADLAKEVTAHAITRGQLTEAYSSLAKVTVERDDLMDKLDELNITLDEKARTEKAASTYSPLTSPAGSQP